VDECLIGDNEDLQVAYLQILIIIIDGDCGNEWRNRYALHLGILQGLSEKHQELNRLISKIEQADQYTQLLRIMRDLFSLNEEKRKFSTLALKQKLNLDSISSDIYKDVGKNADAILKLGKLNKMKMNELDIRRFINIITQKDSLDFSIKKSALEQITHYLSDFSMCLYNLIIGSLKI